MTKTLEQQKIVIVGLGNPGAEYAGTRHNAGFLFIDFLLNRLDQNEIKLKKTKNALVYIYDENLILVKPQTFMNRSGEAVREFVKWSNVNAKEELILAHDDLDIPLGKTKLQVAKSPQVHNGVKSVENYLGTTHFQRLRIGVENRQGKNISGQSYVLKKFTEDELIELQNSFDKAAGKLSLL